jgi:tRNA nucleotidyltransferase/poly(A) polymerase
MPDYIYLLENRLSADQRSALHHLREAAREAGMILFLTGDAVRDLTSGHAVRELEVAVHGDALKLKKPLEKSGAKTWGEAEASRTLYLCFPGTVRVNVVSTHRIEFPKPGQPIYHAASIQDDLRRRDFTVNAMAISLNEGSFGLLMDPLNGAADIEARILRLVSNYGFIEQPALLIRATRYRASLGWDLDPRTQVRYDNAKGDGVIQYLSPEARSEELEQIGHEEDALKILLAFEAEGWMNELFPAWTAAKADEEKLKTLHEQAVELLLQGVHADTSAAQMQLLTAKMAPKDLAALKKQMLCPGFVEEWNSLDSLAAGFQKALLAKENQVPSAGYKLFMSYDPEAILWLRFTTKNQAVLDHFDQLLKVWPEVRQRIPHALMQEMRITPELPAYSEIVHSIFLELIDGHLTTPEEMRAFLEPHSPPAPPPQVTIKRTRAKRGEARIKDADLEDEESEAPDEEEDEDDMGLGDDEEMDLPIPVPKGAMEDDEDEGEPSKEEAEAEDDDEEEEEAPAPRRGGKPAPAAKTAAKAAPATAPAHQEKAPEPSKPKSEPKSAAPAPAHAAKPAAKPDLPKPEPPKPAPVKQAPPAKSVPAKAPAPVKQAPKPPVKAPVKPAAKPPVKSAAKSAPAKPAPKANLRPAPKKPAPKPGKKH